MADDQKPAQLTPAELEQVRELLAARSQLLELARGIEALERPAGAVEVLTRCDHRARVLAQGKPAPICSWELADGEATCTVCGTTAKGSYLLAEIGRAAGRTRRNDA